MAQVVVVRPDAIAGHVELVSQRPAPLGSLSWLAPVVRHAHRLAILQLAERQAIQWPLVELATDVQLLRTFVRETARQMDSGDRIRGVSDTVSMCNFRANRLACDAADRAMQVHGGIGYTRHKPFEHIYRHHRRYRITEGSEEIQIRNVAGHLFGFLQR